MAKNKGKYDALCKVWNEKKKMFCPVNNYGLYIRVVLQKIFNSIVL